MNCVKRMRNTLNPYMYCKINFVYVAVLLLSLKHFFLYILRIIFHIDLTWQHQFSQAEEATSKILAPRHCLFNLYHYCSACRHRTFCRLNFMSVFSLHNTTGQTTKITGCGGPPSPPPIRGTLSCRIFALVYLANQKHLTFKIYTVMLQATIRGFGKGFHLFFQTR